MRVSTARHSYNRCCKTYNKKEILKYWCIYDNICKIWICVTLKLSLRSSFHLQKLSYNVPSNKLCSLASPLVFEFFLDKKELKLGKVTWTSKLCIFVACQEEWHKPQRLGNSSWYLFDRFLLVQNSTPIFSSSPKLLLI